jgi:hypothetical protein
LLTLREITDLPDGQISSPSTRLPIVVCPAPFAKIFRFRRRANHFYNSRRPVPLEGRCATSSTRGGMRWTRAVLLTRAPIRGRRSRVVLTPRRRRQACGGNCAGDGDKKARSPGRARRKPLKPLRVGMPGCSGVTAVTNSCALFISHARLRVHWAPGIPHALRGEWIMHNSGALRRGNAEARHCERSEAIHLAA